MPCSCSCRSSARNPAREETRWSRSEMPTAWIAPVATKRMHGIGAISERAWLRSRTRPRACAERCASSFLERGDPRHVVRSDERWDVDCRNETANDRLSESLSSSGNSHSSCACLRLCDYRDCDKAYGLLPLSLVSSETGNARHERVRRAYQLDTLAQLQTTPHSHTK